VKYLIMMNHSLDETDTPDQRWSAEDVKASWGHMSQIWHELTEAGELARSGRQAGAGDSQVMIDARLDRSDRLEVEAALDPGSLGRDLLQRAREDDLVGPLPDSRELGALRGLRSDAGVGRSPIRSSSGRSSGRRGKSRRSARSR